MAKGEKQVGDTKKRVTWATFSNKWPSFSISGPHFRGVTGIKPAKTLKVSGDKWGSGPSLSFSGSKFFWQFPADRWKVVTLFVGIGLCRKRQPEHTTDRRGEITRRRAALFAARRYLFPLPPPAPPSRALPPKAICNPWG